MKLIKNLFGIFFLGIAAILVFWSIIGFADGGFSIKGLFGLVPLIAIVLLFAIRGNLLMKKNSPSLESKVDNRLIKFNSILNITLGLAVIVYLLYYLLKTYY